MIYLCSSSPTRAMLLDKFKIDYIQKSVDFDEERIDTDDAREFVYLASKGKLQSAISLYGLDTPLLSADTVIVSDKKEILRKPKTKEEAKEILLKQSGSYISIISSLHYQSREFLFTNISSTKYHFKKFDNDKLEEYLDSNLWQGKAGGCMVEGFCKDYIKMVDGLESCAMGLQVEILKGWIR